MNTLKGTRKILIIIVGIFLISLTSAAISHLGTFAQGDCVNLPQSCITCTYNNISRISVENTNQSIITEEISMQKAGIMYNYSFCNTSVLGGYIVEGHGDIDGTDESWNYGFEVTYTGKELSSASSTFYMVLFAIFILLFIATIFGINKLPNSNAADDEGKIVKISYLKYLRTALWFIEWMFIVAVLYIASNLAFAYLEETLFANFFFTLYRISFGLTLPIVVIWFIWIFAKIVDDRNIKKMWERGFFKQKII